MRIAAIALVLVVTKTSLTSAHGQEPAAPTSNVQASVRRGLPPPFASPPYPSGEYQGYPLIGIPPSDATWPLTDFLYERSFGDWLRRKRIKAYGWLTGSANLSTSWGPGGGSGLVSVLYAFEGQAAHSAGAPWRGRSALDAVELMNIGWNYRREHRRLQQRSHYVIPDGGDQPNVVPQTASIWFYFRHLDYERTLPMFEAARKMAQGAALMTETQVDTVMIIGSAMDQHFNKSIAETMSKNIMRVGMPKWDNNDITLARALQ